ncbi:hypothetical protein [Xenorhabdus miraniensis]|uniref:hypothetical protein n=1 Tax=Xenorhabdus miraniensis TaxID=351674 RepID=UPI001FCA165E|nr:hypothetical protein [Xenorhabdus miraniensis]
MSKRGDAYLRGILIHGARSVVYRSNKRPDEHCNELQRWLKGLIERIEAEYMFATTFVRKIFSST